MDLLCSSSYWIGSLRVIMRATFVKLGRFRRLTVPEPLDGNSEIDRSAVRVGLRPGPMASWSGVISVAIWVLINNSQSRVGAR